MKIKEKIGQGSFGHVYLGLSNGTEYALKVEQISKKDQNPHLYKDFKVYCALYGIESTNFISFDPSNNKTRPRDGFANFFAFTKDEQFVYLVMEPLLNNISSILSIIPTGCFNLYTVLYFSLMAIDRLETLHLVGYIHRDIKPDNFVTRKNIENHICLIDFGLSKKYIDKETATHVKFTDNNPIVGTPRFMSIAAHKGFEHGRKDDIESLFYLIVYLAKGKLPWQTSDNSKKSLDIIKEMKEKINPNELFKDLPSSLAKIFTEIRKLQFEDEPPYKMIREKLKKELIKIDNKVLQLKYVGYSEVRTELPIEKKNKHVQFRNTDLPRGVQQLENQEGERIKRKRKVVATTTVIFEDINVVYERESIDARIRRRLDESDISMTVLLVDNKAVNGGSIMCLLITSRK